MELYTAFIIGVVGSLHCIGMCGPIAVMLPVNSNDRIKFITGRVIYNAGRILSYIFMGAVIGFIGNKIFLYGYQQSLSIITGIIILIVVLMPYKLRASITAAASGNKLFFSLKNTIGRLFKKKTSASLFTIGILNGFLPCGLVYVGLGTAGVSGSVFSGMMVMMLFGLGTLPVMLAVSSLNSFFPINFRNKAAKLIPVFAAVLAIIFILRGLNLGIPYISPKMDKMVVNQIECSH